MQNKIAIFQQNASFLLIALVVSLHATPSNSVQVAFGQDIDCDENLSLRKFCMMLGWSGCEWFIRRKGDHVWEHYAETSTAGSRSLETGRWNFSEDFSILHETRPSQ